MDLQTIRLNIQQDVGWAREILIFPTKWSNIHCYLSLNASGIHRIRPFCCIFSDPSFQKYVTEVAYSTIQFRKQKNQNVTLNALFFRLSLFFCSPCVLVMNMRMIRSHIYQKSTHQRKKGYNGIVQHVFPINFLIPILCIMVIISYT